jgi:hypothetical protein
VIEAEIITGTNKGERVFLLRITLSPSDEDIPFDFKIRQFHIKLAYSLAINKSQGQTIKKVGFMLILLFINMVNYIQFYRELLKNRL